MGYCHLDIWKYQVVIRHFLEKMWERELILAVHNLLSNNVYDCQVHLKGKNDRYRPLILLRCDALEVEYPVLGNIINIEKRFILLMLTTFPRQSPIL